MERRFCKQHAPGAYEQSISHLSRKHAKLRTATDQPSYVRSKADQDLAEGLDRAVTAINKVYYEQGRVDTLDWRTQCDNTSDSLLRSCFVIVLAGQLAPTAAFQAWRR